MVTGGVSNSLVVIGQVGMRMDDPDYPAIVLASYMFGEPITSRIADRIRNREGLSYGANARIIDLAWSTVDTEEDARAWSLTLRHQVRAR